MRNGSFLGETAVLTTDFQERVTRFARSAMITKVFGICVLILFFPV